MKFERFKDAFKKGLGRAYIYVKNHGDNASKIKNLLEQGCIENLAYDRQCEGSRSEWVYRILKYTNESEHYEKYTINKLPQLEGGSWDMDHALGILKCFAKDGSGLARKELYAFYAEHVGRKWNESWVGGHQIIDLDGMDGFLFAIQQVGKALSEVDKMWEDEGLMMHAVESGIDEKELLRQLHIAAQRCQYTKLYKESALPNYEKALIRDSQRNSKDYKKPSLTERRKTFSLTWKEVLEKIEDPEKFEKYPSVYMQFGMLASDEEIEEITDRIQHEKREDQLIRYAWLFRRRFKQGKQMPERIIKSLLRILKSNNSDLLESVSYTLSSINDPRIREIGREWLKRDMGQSFCRPYEILESSVQQEDTELIAAYFDRLDTNMNDDQWHDLVMTLTSLADHIQVDTHIQRILEIAYEMTPCSLCRNEVYEHLKSSGLDNLKEEYQYDSYVNS